ncbi:hypothetical protein [Tautonia sociabilis]|uniref:Uncharacterized protein n=1 Tax=Tautonia sociabilis TaxID=2080755 RepID=A0A432MIB4_9BACT|nr:hypothetical protein [Tautonia sociabilis]RUL86945.1 hypothetical protein TsocGM_14995 [Tautonia sociabilis]
MTRRSDLDPASVALLDRTRSSVMTVLALDGLLIAASGLALRTRGPGMTLWPFEDAYRWSHLALLALMFVGSVVRLAGTARAVLERPEGRARWFFWSHTLSALLGLAALPLGFTYAWAVRPLLSAVAPFWGVALVLGLLALPRVDELAGFDEPPSPRRPLFPHRRCRDADEPRPPSRPLP